jgi:hypothetical protein
MTDFAAIESVRIPKTVVDQGQLFLRKAGAAGCEGMVLWIGRPADKTFHVTDLLIPRQKGIKTKDGVCVVVEGEEMHRINMGLFESGLRLIAQVHSHPTHAYHSDTDDRYAIATTTGCFSLVVPDFAVRSFSLAECATYRLRKTGEWSEVPPERVRSTLIIESR